MKIVTQMLAVDRRNGLTRPVTVITARRVPCTAVEAARDALRDSARTHAGRLSLPGRSS